MRCYNGCPDSALQEVIEARNALDDKLKARGARAVYFPMEERWACFDANSYRALTGFFSSHAAAANKCLALN